MRKLRTRVKKVASVPFFIFSRTTSKTRSDFTSIFGFQFRRLFVDRDEGQFFVDFDQNLSYSLFSHV